MFAIGKQLVRQAGTWRGICPPMLSDEELHILTTSQVENHLLADDNRRVDTLIGGMAE